MNRLSPTTWPIAVILVLLGITLGPAAGAETENVLQGSISPAVTFVHVDGDEEKFREDQWLSEDWSGGVQELQLVHGLEGDWTLDLEGRAVFDEHDYRLRLELAQPELGFFRLGYREYRKYYDGTGGYYAPAGVAPFELDKELALDIGQFDLTLGLTVPDWPLLELGYEYRFRDGQKSLTGWGRSGLFQRNISPTYKLVDEAVHVLRAEISHQVGSVRVTDRFRYEDAEIETERRERRLANNGALVEATNIRETYEHDAFFNTFHMESHVNEQVYWSLGYLFNSVESDVDFDRIVGGTPMSPAAWAAIDQDAHVVNSAVFYNPWEEFSVYGGLEYENTGTEGDTVDTVLLNSDQDKDGLEGRVGVRFTGIPWTTLYAEGELGQDHIDLREREGGGLSPFQRQTETEAWRQKYSIGFNTAPLAKLTWSGRYRYRLTENYHDHDLVGPVDGYPAYLDFQEREGNEINTRVTYRVLPQVRVAFQFQLIQSDIETRNIHSNPLIGGNQIQTGNYDAQVYSLGVTATPMARLYVTALGSYQDARSTSYDNGVGSVVSYDGDVYSLIGACGYALTEEADLTLQYVFSKSDNFKNNSTAGLPLGVDNERHGLTAAVSFQISDNARARIGYGYYDYQDRTAGGADDYSAHLASGSVSLRF